jgi:hypothetical protein
VKRKRGKPKLAHFRVVARVDKAQATPAKVTINRETGLVTMGRLYARRRWRIQLSTLVELGMGRLLREEAEMLMRVRR